MLVAARRESPLILGMGEANLPGLGRSRHPALHRPGIFLEDDDIAVLQEGSFLLLNQEGERIEHPRNTITWSPAMRRRRATSTSC